MKKEEKEAKIKKISKHIDVPKDIHIKIEHKRMILEKGSDKIKVSLNPVYLEIRKKDESIDIIPRDTKKKNLAVINTTYKLINNAITGFEKEYIYKLAIVYSHFPMSIKVEGNSVLISNFLGEKNPRKIKIIEGCKVDIKGKEITVTGIDKYSTGQTAGNIERATRITKKDYRVFDDGCYIVRKGDVILNK